MGNINPAPTPMRHWLNSGCGIYSFLIAYYFIRGRGNERPLVPLTILISVNIVYAVASTSWLLDGILAASKYPLVPLVCLIVSPTTASLGRYVVRRLLRRLDFTKHGIGLFHPPALRIDTEVDGLFVVRGLSFSPERLSIEAHGIEVAVQLSQHMQLALYVNNLTVKLSRSIDIGEVYGTIKDESAETIFRDSLSDGEQRAAISKIRQPLAHGDQDAEEQYRKLCGQIWDTSPINESRRHAQNAENKERTQLTERQLRAATCGRLAGSPTVPNAPSSSVRVTTLQNLIPRWLARFLARLPFLLRVVLMLLSYLHPISIPSITIAGPGHWLAEMLQRRILDHYLEDSSESQELQDKANEWLENAAFNADFTGISAFGQVPVRTMHNVTAELRCAGTTVFRTAPDVVEAAIELAGADMEIVLPSYLLPHHEHLVPEAPNRAQGSALEEPHNRRDEDSRNAQPDHDEDCAHLYMRAHANLPAATDHSLLEFVVDLANVSKMFELQQQSRNSPEDTTESQRDDHDYQGNGNGEEVRASKSGVRERTKRALRNHVKDRAKQLAMRGLNNDQSEWVKTLVRSTASQLERMHGDVGYSGSMSVPLGPYRGSHSVASKLMP